MKEKISCGVSLFVRMALSEHRKNYYGENAKSVILHPESFCDFISQITVHSSILQAESDSVMFEGVIVCASYESGTPKLINCKNQVVYL